MNWILIIEFELNFLKFIYTIWFNEPLNVNLPVICIWTECWVEQDWWCMLILMVVKQKFKELIIYWEFSFFERKHWLGLSTSNAVWIFWLDFIKARRTANNFLSQLFRDVTATWFIWWRTVDSTTLHVAFLSWIGSKLALD